ncbi:MAG: hypothetical protein ACWGN7_05105 [Thermodesulfovibrionales bacterium]
MRRHFLRGCVVIICLLAASCASGEKKVPPPEALTAEKAFSTAIEIRDAFVKDDAGKLRSLCADPLFETISSSRQKFETVSLEFTMRWVDIDYDATVHLYVAWKRSAVIDDKDSSDSGMGVFMMRGEPLKAFEIVRDSPFQ